MAADREKILQAAQKYVNKKKYDKAIIEYQKIVQSDPNDARTLLKLGDLQARMEQYPEAIATYDRVGQFYSAQGFALKAIAVYKQIRELIQKHAPQLGDRYGHIVPKLAEIYTELGLTSDALAAYDEVATRFQRAGRDRDAIEVFEKMVSLDSTNPLPHLRHAEACCRVEDGDSAIASFWAAAELLIGMERPDDALKVIERLLHFRAEPTYARVAAELYLAKGGQQAGLHALAKLQISFQANPQDLDTLGLLASAFTTIGQSSKAIEVQKEMARLAHSGGRPELYNELIGFLRQVATDDPQVVELIALGDPTGRAEEPSAEQISADAIEADAIPVEDDLLEEVDLLEDDFEEIAPEESAPGIDTSEVMVDNVNAPARVAVQRAPPAEERQSYDYKDADGSGHAHKALVDAESYRSVKLYDKAIETLQIAQEVAPQSIEIRERLRDIRAESGDRDGAIQEMISLAAVYIERGDGNAAESQLYQVLEAEPEHPIAYEMLEQIGAFSPEDYGAVEDTATQTVDSYPLEEPLPSYDLEGVSPQSAIISEPPPAAPVHNALATVDDPFASTDDEPLPSYPLSDEDEEEIEEILDESAFFESRGLYEDAKMILADQLARTPGHPKVTRRLREVEKAMNVGSKSGTRDRAALESEGQTEDNAFDIAASLDALDDVPKQAAPSGGGLTQNADEVDVDEVFAKFKEGVRAQVSDADSATHYDLGVAYKEMGLFNDSIQEFEVASNDPARACMSFSMVAMIHFEQGHLDQAAEAYIRGLGAPKKTIDQEMAIYYELGTIYDMKDSTEEALYYLKKIAQRDPTYRDVSERIRQLESTDDEAPPQSQVNKDDDNEFDELFDNLFDAK